MLEYKGGEQMNNLNLDFSTILNVLVALIIARVFELILVTVLTVAKDRLEEKRKVDEVMSTVFQKKPYSTQQKPLGL